MRSADAATAADRAVVIELIGILLVMEGAGGLINRLAGGGSPGWFLQLELVPSEFGVTASVVVLLAGVLVLMGSRTRRDRTRRGRDSH